VASCGHASRGPRAVTALPIGPDADRDTSGLWVAGSLDPWPFGGGWSGYSDDWCGGPMMRWVIDALLACSASLYSVEQLPPMPEHARRPRANPRRRPGPHGLPRGKPSTSA
jgi:hypothetical protein